MAATAESEWRYIQAGCVIFIIVFVLFFKGDKMGEETKTEPATPSIIMPFMYNVYDYEEPTYKYVKTLVVIGHWDLNMYCHEWWGEESLNDKVVLSPDIDLATEKHEFTSELDAIHFIKEWWLNHKIE